MNNPKSSERGQALVVIALSAVVLFGFVALAIDGTAKFSDRRHAQNAADTAALAGALALANEETGACGTLEQWECDALLRAEDNGYDDLTNNEVWVFKCDSLVADRGGAPLDCGPYEGKEHYVSVIILSHVDTSFARVIGFTQTHNLVQAVSYYKVGGELADGAMIISYDPDPNCSAGAGSGGGSVDVSGSGIVNLNGGGIFMNSDEVCGFAIPNCAELNISGSAGVNSVASVDNIDQDGCSSAAPENFNQEAYVIPDDVYWPSVPPECSTAAPTPTLLGTGSGGYQAWLIYPGYYTDFPQAGLVPNNKHIFMASGVYCIDPPMSQDLSWSGSSFKSLNGSTDPGENTYHAYNPDGVTLYVRSGGGFSLSINSPIYLDASTDGDYQGFLLVLEGTHTSIENCTVNGGAYLDINGLIHAPYCNITVNGGSDSTAEINAQLIGWDIKITGNNTINFNYDPDNQVTIKRRVGLMR